MDNNVYNGNNSLIQHLDVGYSALWDKRDSDIISKKFKKIADLSNELKLLNTNSSLAYAYRNTVTGMEYDSLINDMNIIKAKKSLLVDEFETQLERFYNDQTTVLEPLEVNKQYDRVVNTGMGKIAEFVVGESVQFFNHFAAGISDTPVYQGDTELGEELARISIELQGYATASGSVIKYGGHFGTNITSATIKEAGVFDEMENGNMLFRTVYPANKYIIHTQGSTFFTLSHAIYQSSI